MNAIIKTAAAGQEPITMTSLELVDFINEQRKAGEPELRHDHFMAKVPKVLGQEAVPNFRDSYIGRDNTSRPCYRLPKREACLMAMSYSYELQAKVFDRMTELEANQAPKVPTTMAQALRLAAEQAEILEKQQAQLALAAPKVEFVDRFVQSSTGSKGFREVCKLLKVNEAEFRCFVIDRQIMYRLAGQLTARQNHIDAGRFEVKAGVADNDHAYTTTKFTAKGVEWIAGLWGQHQAKQQAKNGVPA